MMGLTWGGQGRAAQGFWSLDARESRVNWKPGEKLWLEHRHIVNNIIGQG